MKKYIAYYRVSTKKQGDSGLGLESQEQQVKAYIEREGGVLLNQYTEIETGTRRRKRIQIHKAIAESQDSGATLIVAKLDRLSRDVEFTYYLLNAEINFLCLDMPGANETTIGLMSVMAQSEAKRIRERIVSALDAKRARGDNMSHIENLKGRHIEGAKVSVEVRKELAEVKNKKAVFLIGQLRNDANYSYSRIAHSLNTLEFKTSREGLFTPKQVELLYKKYYPALQVAAAA